MLFSYCQVELVIEGGSHDRLVSAEGDVGSEIATGSGEVMSVGEEQLQEDGLSEISETGWETDLEIEGQLIASQLQC